MLEYMLSTVDNPFNPLVDFDSWKAYDEAQGYFTCDYLARIAITSDDLSVDEQALAIDTAIDEIIKYNILGIYKKVEV